MNLRNFLKVFLKCSLLLQLNSVALGILSGKVINIDKVPFIVQIHKNGEFHCGGTLISDYLVVTAAHCVAKFAVKEFVVVGLASKITDKGVRSKVEKIFVANEYNPSTLHMDVAVMKLETRFNNIQKASICPQNRSSHNHVQLFGWGAIKKGSESISEELRTDELVLMDYADCKLIKKQKITESMFCTIGDVRGPGNGDSGGPVLHDGCFFGIISCDFALEENILVSAHTSLEYAITFINKIKQSTS